MFHFIDKGYLGNANYTSKLLVYKFCCCLQIAKIMLFLHERTNIDDEINTHSTSKTKALLQLKKRKDSVRRLLK